MDKITQSILETFVNQYELEKKDAAKQFEYFSNHCIISKLNRSSFELDDIHTGSGGDCAIDGFCLVVNGKIILDIDELNEIVTKSGFLDGEIIFIQSKTTSSFSGSDIGSFINGVKDFLSDESRLVQNEKIKYMKLLWEEVIKNSSHMVNRRPYCKLFYVCTGKWMADQNLQAIIDIGIREVDAIGIFDRVEITPLGANEIQRLYQETKNKLSTTINFQNRITLPDIQGVSEAYLGVVPFREFIKLIQDDNQTIHNIFDDNVRDFQGENAVNAKIKTTLQKRQFDLFCVLNNGVTIVASTLTPAGNRFTLRDYQVVNGCQTSNILHECRNLDGIDSVSVPVKIIVTDSDDIKTTITLATNSQTEVKTEQLESLGLFQKKLELYFTSEKSGVRLYYERRSQQYNSLNIKRKQIISIPIQIKTFASMFLSSPHLVSGYYGTIVTRFKGKIFSEQHKYIPYFVSALCYFKIEQFFGTGDLPAEYKKSRFYIMMIAKMIGMNGEECQLNSAKIEKQCEAFKTILLNDSKILDIFKTSINIFRNSGVDLTKRQYKSGTDTEIIIAATNNYLRENT